MAERCAITIVYDRGSPRSGPRIITPRLVLKVHGEAYVVAHCHMGDVREHLGWIASGNVGSNSRRSRRHVSAHDGGVSPRDHLLLSCDTIVDRADPSVARCPWQIGGHPRGLCTRVLPDSAGCHAALPAALSTVYHRRFSDLVWQLLAITRSCCPTMPSSGWRVIRQGLPWLDLRLTCHANVDPAHPMESSARGDAPTSPGRSPRGCASMRSRWPSQGLPLICGLINRRMGDQCSHARVCQEA